ncbi:MAG: hypothetical protein C0592_05845 [Marinilabiliales bacterium]|nr:MAG: hypothetical protein C0592_05845 [Marinilabiliales bacterium]
MKKIFVLIIVLISIQMNAQNTVKARLTTLADNSNAKEMEAVCDSMPGFDFIAKNFNFPPSINDNIVYFDQDEADHPNALGIGNMYNLFDELGRLRTFFYFGSLVSGMTPQAYIFEYAENTEIIIRLTDDADNSTYNIIYGDGLITAIKHYNSEGELLETLDLMYE